jgi:hypothetical protein
VSESFDLGVSEGHNAMLGLRRLSMPIRVANVIRNLLGLLMCCQMILLPMLFGDPMRMGSAVL